MKYIILKSDIFIFKREKYVLLYDTVKNNQYVFLCTNEMLIIINEWLDVKNMYCATLDENLLAETVSWIEELDRRGFVSISDNKSLFSIPPDLIVNSKCEQITFDYLHRIVVNLGGSDKNEYYKQFYYPIFAKNNKVNIDHIINFLNSILICPLNEIVFIMDDLCENEGIIDFIHEIDSRIKIKIYIKQISQKLFNSVYRNDIDIVIIYDSPYDYIKNKTVIDHIPNLKVNVIIKGVDDLNLIDSFLNDKNINIQPFYDHSNDDFFKDHIYMNKSDLGNIQLDKREIFRNQLINPIFFGQIYIYPDGKVSADPNFHIVATIYDNIEGIIKKMMLPNYAWKFTRKNYPCNICLYQWLCPSISTYELVLKHPLCYNYL